MKIKIKKKIKKALTKKALAVVGRCEKYCDYSFKLRDLRTKGGESSVMPFVAQQYKLWYNEDPPTDQPNKLIEIKVGYKILIHDIKGRGEEPSPEVLKNYKASQNFNLKGFDKEMQSLLKIAIKKTQISQEKEEEMTKVRKKAAAKAQATKAAKSGGKKITKGETWGAILKENFKKKLTDEQLAKEMTKRMGDGNTYTEDQVKKARGFFNFGALSSKVEKPSEPLKQFGGASSSSAKKKATVSKVKTKKKLKIKRKK